ncbi:sugar 3,4-ketoisomerase [Phyllobacterium myrsinacearum]|uniref:sugar 3,4-ketoisomerase n=1 Tax=Phyllobacterium myrsinacearum TaxID=28101 RepID=UPI00102904E5|nr:FdtA/QdtA family cupin domain-containing protein [Phyllobacterium myrsinacearum]
MLSSDFDIRSHFLLKIPTLPDERGKLAVIEPERMLPFKIRRTYHLYDVPAGAERGGHAHMALDQLLIAISGSFSVEVEDSHGKHAYMLNQPNEALYIGSMVWRAMTNFSSNAVCLVLASEPYDESDYIRSYDDFRAKIAEVKNASPVC